MEKSDIRDDVTIKTPQIHETSFVAKGARVIGDVILKAESSIWYNTVARADINQIIIGERSNIQDNSVTGFNGKYIVDNKIGKGAVVGAGAVVKENMVVDDYQLVVGVPAKIVKTLTSSTYDANVKWAKKYVQLASIHKNRN